MNNGVGGQSGLPAERSHNTQLFRYRFGNAEFDESSFELRVGGVVMDVEHRALQVLGCLLHHAGQAVTKEDLFREVWRGRITVDKVLPNAVTKLRRALGENNAMLLEALPRIGYRLSGVTERVAVGRRPWSRLELAEGRQIPRREHFLLRRQLGGSRVNEVWLAEHRKTAERRVYKFAADGSSLSALKREATLSRVLEKGLGRRPDIVRVLDWSFDDTPFYLESEYGGPNLLEWSQDGSNLANLSADERLALFLQIADVVAAAHSLGVIHKDLKPANILVANVNGASQVRLTDFGSGHLLEPEQLKALGITQLDLGSAQNLDSTSGTPLYLAPEVLAGRPFTIQSDVYALGVVLYQVMTGDLARPMAPGWEQEIDDPLLREDIAKAADGAPARRLKSADELAERLRALPARRAELQTRHDEQERAQFAEQALQLARARQPWMVTAIATLLAGIIASTLLYRESRIQWMEAKRQTAIAGAVSKFLQADLLSAASPNEAGQRELTVREAVVRAEGRIDRRFGAQPDLAASLRLTLAQVQFDLGELSAAEGQARRVLELLADAGSADTTVLMARYLLALILAHGSQFDEAQIQLQLADKGYVAAKSPPELVVMANYSHGMLKLQQQDQVADAIPLFERALQAQRLADADDAGAIVEIQTKLAQALAYATRYAESDTLSEAMLASYDPAEPKTALRLSMARLNYGESLLVQERYDEAEPVLRQAYQDMLEGLGPENYRTTKGLADLASLYASTGQWSRATQTYREVNTALTRQVGADHALTLAMFGWLGAVEYESGDTTAAIDKLQRVRDELGVRYPEFGRPFIHCFGYYLAAAYTQVSRLDEAETVLASIDAALAAASCDATIDARLQGLRGQIEFKRGHRDRALPLLQAAAARLAELKAAEFVVAPVREALRAAGVGPAP